ncbi:hypothetical protein ABTL91_18745, partial [Acinetobacter baumannii]
LRPKSHQGALHGFFTLVASPKRHRVAQTLYDDVARGDRDHTSNTREGWGCELHPNNGPRSHRSIATSDGKSPLRFE